MDIVEKGELDTLDMNARLKGALRQFMDANPEASALAVAAGISTFIDELAQADPFLGRIIREMIARGANNGHR